MAYNVEGVTDVAVFGEGPHWSTEEQALYYVDMFEQYVNRYHPSTGLQTKLHIDGGPVTTVVPHKTQPNTFIIGLGHSIAAVTWPDPTQNASVALEDVMILATVEEDKPANRFNDGKCDANGRLWAATMGNTDMPDNLNPEQAALYRLDNNRTINQVIDKVSLGNGMAWTGDNTKMYFNDTVIYKVFGFDFDLPTGTVSNQRVAFDFKEAGFDPNVGPDGMTIDTDGNLWVVGFGSGQVFNIEPSSGQIIRSVGPLPVNNVTSVCWGGPDLDQLFVTCGEGPVYRITGLGSKGYPSASCTVDLSKAKSS